MMLDATDTETAPWYIVRSDDKKRARLNCISHLLKQIPYEKVAAEEGQSAECFHKTGVRRSGNAERSTLRAGEVLSGRARLKPRSLHGRLLQP